MRGASEPIFSGVMRPAWADELATKGSELDR